MLFMKKLFDGCKNLRAVQTVVVTRAYPRNALDAVEGILLVRYAAGDGFDEFWMILVEVLAGGGA